MSFLIRFFPIKINETMGTFICIITFIDYGRQNNGLPKMSMFQSKEPVNMSGKRQRGIEIADGIEFFTQLTLLQGDYSRLSR